MLGWEFPPHISGGLGTACQGIARGVRESGVEVLFVVPRLFGDEEPDVSLVSASGAPLPDRAPGVPFGGVEPSSAPTRVQVARLIEDGVVQIAIDSPLHPYDDASMYAMRLEPQRRADSSEAVVAPNVPREPHHEGARPGRSAPPRGVAPLPRKPGADGAPLRGGYGPDLMSEVARYADAVARIVATEQFDVIHAHDWMTFPAGVAAREASGRPLIVHAHALEYDRSGENVDTRIRAIEQNGFDVADRIVCVSQYTAGLVATRYDTDPNKIRVVHNAVDPKARSTGPRDKAIEEPIVLFLGRITFQKGPEYFLRAARRVIDRLPGVKFVMAGTGDMFPRMIEQAAELGLAEHVHFTGFLRGPEVERMYAMADVYIMPSVSEPFGIAPLEALALDVPVIVSKQSGVAEVLSHALKVDFWDVDELATCIVDVLTRPELRQGLVEGGREELKQMQWSARGRHLRGIYEELVG